MSEPAQFTAQQAQDPSTPGEILASIAAERPDLRPYVAANPAAYPGLLDWLGRLGDPAVDAALRARTAPEATAIFPQAPQAPTASAPSADQAHTSPSAESPTAYTPPAGEAPTAYTSPAGEAPTAYTPPAGGYNESPGAYQAPGSQAPYGSPAPGYGAAPGGAPYGGAPYGGPPGGAPYGAPYGGQPPKKSRAWIWIILALVVVGLIGGGIFFVVSRLSDSLGSITSNEDANTYGDDASLDALWDSCESGDMEACDDLYRDSPVGSEYERFGDTCGNRTDGGVWCVDLGTGSGDSSGDGSTDQDSGGDTSGGTTGQAFTYGDDATLDALWDSCQAGDMGACDDLYRDSPVASEYEEFGDTCGGRTDGGTWCNE